MPVCSSCDTEVDEYYHGHRCKPCIKIYQKAWWKKNWKNYKAYRQKWAETHRDQCRQNVARCRKGKRVRYNIHSKLKCRYELKHLTDVYVKRLVRKSYGSDHVITDQEIKDRKKKVVRSRRKRTITAIKREQVKTLTIICPLVQREIPKETCDNMRTHHDKCQECKGV